MPIALNYTRLRTNDYALTHNWNLKLKGGTLRDLSLNNLANLMRNFGGVDGWLNIACTSASLPNSTIKVVSAKIRGCPVHQVAGRDGLQGSITLSAIEHQDYRLHKFFETWKQAEVNRFTLAQNPRARLADGVVLELLGPDRQSIKGTYELYEAYCTDSNTSPLSSNPGIVETKFTIAYMNYCFNTSGINFSQYAVDNPIEDVEVGILEEPLEHGD